MNISDIITKCFILALIIRDDGERLLLGDGFYEFKEQLQHFQPNTFQNDVIELQGTDGQLLAGQVRRGATQSFDGYIADSTISREATEEHRQRFLAFFRKKHHYKVVYVFPDGSAIKRERGYIVDAPSVPEMFQRFPEFHVGLNFEDVNYYEYDEGEDGEEIFAHVQNIAIAGYVEGGLIWDNYGAVSNEITWVDYALKTTTDGYAQITDGVAGAPLNLEQLDGNATQFTTTGKNLFSVSFATGGTTPPSDTNTFTLVKNSSQRTKRFDFPTRLQAGTYTVSLNITNSTASQGLRLNFVKDNSQNIVSTFFTGTGQKSYTMTVPSGVEMYALYFYISNDDADDTTVTATNVMLESGSLATTYEPYTAGASPNPDYPQAVNTVTGLQTVKIYGKNLFDKNAAPVFIYNNTITFEALETGIRAKSTVASTGSNLFGVFIIGESKQFLGKTLTLYSDMMASGSNLTRIYIGLCNATGTSRSAKVQLAASGSMSYTHTAEDATRPYLCVAVYSNSGGTVAVGDYCDYTNLQLEIGDQPTIYSPFGSASYEINLGKNLLPFVAQDFTISSVRFYADNGSLKLNGTSSAEISTTDASYKSNLSFRLDAGTYTYSCVDMPNTINIRLRKSADDTQLAILTSSANTTNFTLSEPTQVYVGIYIGVSTTFTNLEPKLMLEGGSVQTSYSPYFTPYELAKIPGTNYKDAFKRIDGVWYKHAEIGKVVLDGDANINVYNTQNSIIGFRAFTNETIISSPNATPTDGLLSDHYQVTAFNNFYNAQTRAYGTICVASVEITNFYITAPNSTVTTEAQFKTWLTSHPTSVYYALATPTDIQITDQTLIQQLSTIKALVGETDNIWLIPSSGAQGEMEVRYSRGFINQGAGYEWDAAQGGGPNIVSVDGIDRTGFVWEVVGPATNPTLTNITTNQTMTFEGDVAAGQTLTVNTSDQTAKIAGTNVFAQMEGDWMQLAPGNNVITYTATGATEPSKIKWNGVVG